MSDFYVYDSLETANEAIAVLNDEQWYTDGQTVRWAKAPKEMVTGEFAIKRIPEERLDASGVPQEDRDAFMTAYGQDIRDLGPIDFPQPEEE